MTDLERLKLVRQDCQADATIIDGKPATGRVLGEMFGGILASIDCLAKVLENTIKRIEEIERHRRYVQADRAETEEGV